MAVIFSLVRALIMVTLCIFGPQHTLTVVFKAVVFNNTVVVVTEKVRVNCISELLLPDHFHHATQVMEMVWHRYGPVVK
jgi:hypothetical protein